MRNKAWRRHKDYSKALRKAKIVHEQGDYWNYKSSHQLVKGKIHCSCPLCSVKTNKDGYSHSNLKRFKEIEFYEEEACEDGLPRYSEL